MRPPQAQHVGQLMGQRFSPSPLRMNQPDHEAPKVTGLGARASGEVLLQVGEETVEAASGGKLERRQECTAGSAGSRGRVATLSRGDY